MQKWIGEGLIWLGAIALLVFLQPYYKYKLLGHDGRSTSNVRFGWESSPWLTYQSEKVNGQELGPGWRIIARSSSWPWLPAGVGLIWLGMRVKRKLREAGQDVPSAEPAPLATSGS